MFSTGLPIMYPLACIFYTVLFWVYKFLLLKFYAKTTNFNYELPLFSTSYIKIGIFFHIIFGGLMVTNSEIIPSEDTLPDETHEHDGIIAMINNRYLSKNHGWYYFVFTIMLFLYIIWKHTILKITIKVAKYVLFEVMGL